MSNPKIFYFALDVPRPSGGEINTYNHVDVLVDAGFEAYVVHRRSAYRHTWFDNETRVIDMRAFWRIYRQDRDYIVLSEPLGAHIGLFPGKKVIFNKNLYQGFAVFGLERPVSYPYDDHEVVATFANSEHNVSHLRCAFPNARVFRMFARIDGALFKHRPIEAKERHICFVAKAENDLAVLCHLLWARGLKGLNRVGDYKWTFLKGYSQRAIAELLQDAFMLIALNTHEGLPRTVLEAMACGCLVFGYGTGPMKECLLPYSRVEPDDLIHLVAQIERITNEYPRNVEQLTEWSAAGRAVAARFDREQQTRAVLAAWDAILSGQLLDVGASATA